MIPKSNETTIVKAILDYLRMVGVFCWRQNQGGVTAKYKDSPTRFVRFAGADGISDILGVLPTGHALAVEVKKWPNKPSDKQDAFLERVAQNNGLAVVAWSVDDVIAALEIGPGPTVQRVRHRRV